MHNMTITVGEGDNSKLLPVSLYLGSHLEGKTWGKAHVSAGHSLLTTTYLVKHGFPHGNLRRPVGALLMAHALSADRI